MPTFYFTNKQKIIAAALMSASCYAYPSFASNVVSCDTINGVENTAITATTTHLTDNNDGTVSDPKTGLIWKKCSEGLTYNATNNSCTGTAAIYNWQAALQRAQDINNNGTAGALLQNDWHVPNIRELGSIIELRCAGPAINSTVFPGTPANFFWSSSAYEPNNFRAWLVVFGNSSGLGDGRTASTGKNGLFYVRLVRVAGGD